MGRQSMSDDFRLSALDPLALIVAYCLQPYPLSHIEVLLDEKMF